MKIVTYNIYLFLFLTICCSLNLYADTNNNDQCNYAETVTLNYSGNGSLGSSDKSDYFQFTLPSAGTLTITVTNASRDLDAYLYNSTCSNTLASDETNSNNPSISYTYTGASATTLKLELYYYPNRNSTTYNINITFTPSTPTLSIEDVSFNEGSSGVYTKNIPITLSNPSGNTVTVNYTVSSGTATAGSDYNATNGILTFSGATSVQNIPIQISGDTTIESDETFSITLSNATGGASISKASATITLLNDDSPSITIGEREFALRNPASTRNIKGGLQVIGNTVLCVQSNGVCYDYTGGSSNSELDLHYIDVDGVTRNYNNSSQAQLNIPTTATIKWAGLYSQGYLNTYNSTSVATTLQDPIYVTIPTIGTVASVPEVIDLYANSNDGYTYDTFAALPSLIGKTGAAVNGWITGANIKADTGTEGSGLGNFGAWTLVVVYEDSSSSLKNISVYDGYKRVASAAGFNSVNITPSGFLTPTSGTVKSTLSLFVGEGDKNIAGDKLYVNGTAINDTNAFYSTISGFAANPSYSNTEGIDIQNHDIGVDGDTSHPQIIGNGANSATITLTSTQDTYFPSMVAFTTELYEPRVCYVEAYYDADGNATLTTANVGDIITIKTWIANMKKDASDGNLETAQKVEITMEHDDTNLAYQAESTKIQNVGESVYSSKTDANDSDTATFYSDTNTSVWHVGTGATGSDGGDLTPNVTNDAANKAYISFKEKIQTTGDITIANIYKVSYENSNMGLRIGDESPVNIGVCKDFNTSIAVSAPLGVFNVVNQNFSGSTNSNDGTSSDNALYTQIAGQAFQVKLLALNPDYITLKSYTGDVNLSSITAPNYSASDTDEQKQAKCDASIATSTTTVTFNNEDYKMLTLNYPQASKNVAFKIAYNDNGTTKYVCSRDSFAIRPLSYKMDANETHLIGMKSYRLTINAVQDDKETNTTDYNQTILTDTIDKNATLDLNIPTDCNLTAQHDTLTPITFIGGEVIDNNFTFTNVGDINVTIADNDWTLVDQNRQTHKGYDDCIKDSNTSIPVNGKIGCLVQNLKQFTFSPKDFANTLTLQNSDNNFTYIASDSVNNTNMHAILLFTPTARLDNNATATNYTKKCFSRDINYTIAFINNNPISGWLNGLPTARNRIYFKEDNTTFTSQLINNAIQGQATFTSSEGNFTSGIAANLTMALNFTRAMNTPDEPFKIARNDFNITSVIDQNNTTGSDFNRTNDHNATFYYGRVYSTDYRGQSPINATIRYEVYCKDCNTSAFTAIGTQSPTSMTWYQNPLHVIADGNVTAFTPRGITGVVPLASNNINNGLENNALTNNAAANAPYTDTIQMTPSPWLLFNLYNAGAVTNDFSVEFTRSGDWAGQGSLGQTVDVNTSTRTNKRMEW